MRGPYVGQDNIFHKIFIIHHVYSKKVKSAWDDLRKAMRISDLDSEVNKCMRNWQIHIANVMKNDAANEIKM